jgi:hypothetical protein
MLEGKEVQRLVIGFVRGDADPTELAQTGLLLELSESGLQLEEPPGVPVVTPSTSDVASGLLTRRARGREPLAVWARVLLAANFIDLRDLEDNPAGELLLEALWDAADGADVDDRAIDAARGLG